MEYQQLNAEKYEQQFRERELRHLQRKAARLGFTLIPAGAVSWQRVVRPLAVQRYRLLMAANRAATSA